MPRPRKFSGPLRPGTTSTRQKVTKKPRGGLNKTEKAQVDTKIKSAIKKEHTLKYFNSSTLGETAASPAKTIETATGTLYQVSVLGYSSTTNVNNADPEVIQQYGQQSIVPLMLSRPFKELEDTDANYDAKLAGMSMNGNYVIPKIARTMFSIERVPYLEEWRVGGENVPENAARTLPIVCRMVKIGFKAQQGTVVQLEPNLDLFLDVRTGLPTGIDDVGFSRLQCQHAKINTKKYTKLADRTFVINQNNIVSPNAHEFNSGTFQTSQYFQKNGSGTKYLTENFQLSQRKNGKLFYETGSDNIAGDGPVSFTSGGQRTLVLFHFFYQNGHELLGATGQPEAPDSADIQIKFINTSAFVDSQ